MKSFSYIRIFCATSLVVACAACGPVYDTTYSFRPPPTSTGRVCASQCETSRYQCLQLEEVRSRECQYRADRDRDYCERQIRIDKGRSPKWYECGTESCSADEEHCESSYRNCYQACGGSVTADTRCVANCDKIPGQNSQGSYDKAKPSKKSSSSTKSKSESKGSSSYKDSY